MSEYSLDIAGFIEKAGSMPVIDVRSPAEFDRGHIPGALNMPLFNNEERSVIGTLYLKKGSDQAMKRGLEIIRPKQKEFAEMAGNIAPGGELLMHCWRGGMRSNSLAWLLNTAGTHTWTLEGGYKSYRRFVHASFEKPLNLVVIGGMTGSGKTDVLEALESKGKQVIHLERIARHKGSAFGGIGMPDQPGTEQFENDLFHQISQLNPAEITYIEDESLAIGKVFIPGSFFKQMSNADFIKLVVPLKRRIKKLVKTYTECDPEILITSVKRIEKRLGLENASEIIGHIRQGDMNAAVELILVYYDKIYYRSMSLHNRRESHQLTVDLQSEAEIGDMIIKLTDL